MTAATEGDRMTGALLTVEDVAGRLKVSERTVRTWIASGALTSVKLGGHARSPRRVSEGALAEFIASHPEPEDAA